MQEQPQQELTLQGSHDECIAARGVPQQSQTAEESPGLKQEGMTAGVHGSGQEIRRLFGEMAGVTLKLKQRQNAKAGGSVNPPPVGQRPEQAAGTLKTLPLQTYRFPGELVPGSPGRAVLPASQVPRASGNDRRQRHEGGAEGTENLTAAAGFYAHHADS